jgi:heat shock protein HslJ
MKSLFLGLLTLVATALVGCGASQNIGTNSKETASDMASETATEVAGEASLTGTYTVTAIKGYVLNSTDTSWVEFDDETGRVSAKLGCNNVSGTYALDGNQVTFNKNFMATRMYCEGQMGLEDQFQKVIPGATCNITSLGNQVVLISPEGDELLRLTKK